MKKGTVSFKFNTINNMDDPADLSQGYSQKGFLIGENVNLLNVDTDNSGGFSRRNGYSLALAGNFRGRWSNGKISYVVSGNGIYQFSGTALTLKNVLLNSVHPVCFCAVNDYVYYSNGYEFGVVGQTSADLSTRPFRGFMQPGHAMSFYNGRLYVLNGSTLYCSDTFDADNMDHRAKVVANFDGVCRTIAAVDNGIYIGTDQEQFFFSGADPFAPSGGFIQQSVGNYGSISGTEIITKGEKIGALDITGTVAIWNTEQGICIGGHSGHFINLSKNKVSTGYGAQGSAIIREQNGLIHYLCSVDTTETAYNKLTDLNLAEL